MKNKNNTMELKKLFIFIFRQTLAYSWHIESRIVPNTTHAHIQWVPTVLFQNWKQPELLVTIFNKFYLKFWQSYQLNYYMSFSKYKYKHI